MAEFLILTVFQAIYFLERIMTYTRTKRFFDLFGALLLFFLLSPVYLLSVFLIWLTIKRPVHFRQMRMGYRNKPFKMYKFRTMKNDVDANGDLLPDEERLTLLGRFLRHTSLDELPQLINVIRGDMSLVGPRPQLACFTDNCTERELERFNALPGITGWAQVNGRNAITWKQKFEHDLWYVQHQSLTVDLMIIFKTLPTVLKRRGINREVITEIDRAVIKNGGKVTKEAKIIELNPDQLNNESVDRDKVESSTNEESNISSVGK